MQQIENDYENDNGNEVQIPTQFTHSVKIEQTAKGARVTVHVNANNGLEAMGQAINMYRATGLQLEQLKEVVAPVEIKA
jgi:ribosome-associated translation inhibitor RaiA